MLKINPKPAPMRSWLIALILLGCVGALLSVYALTNEGVDSILDLLAA
jgi:hypothetical protein